MRLDYLCTIQSIQRHCLAASEAQRAKTMLERCTSIENITKVMIQRWKNTLLSADVATRTPAAIPHLTKAECEAHAARHLPIWSTLQGGRRGKL